jgi:ubiquinone/menaquinone biosynthesis C-methylase UbiE
MSHELAYQARNFARFYDWTYARHTQDIPFYLELARRYGDPVLELACGTGRLAIPLARAGFAVTGLDLSPEMLRLARAKLRQEPPAVRRRVKLVQGDMANFDLALAARLAFVPFSSFFHLSTPRQRAACIAAAYRHLAPGGAFLVDLLPPRAMANQAVVDRPEELKCEVNPATGLLTRELHQRLSLDRERRATTIAHTYCEQRPDGRERQYRFVQSYYWTTPEELVQHFEQAGFQRVRCCGGYGLRPLRERSYRMIVMGEK